jgi:hypothetical protein
METVKLEIPNARVVRNSMLPDGIVQVIIDKGISDPPITDTILFAKEEWVTSDRDLHHDSGLSKA